MLGVEVRYLLDGEEVENTFGVSGLTTYDTTNAQIVVDNLLESWLTNILPLLSPLTQLIEVYAKDLSVHDSWEVSAPTTAAHYGALGGETHPNNVTVAISCRTGFTGRSNRGRMFLPGMTINSVYQNTIDDDWASAILAGFAATSAAVKATAAEGVMGVISRYHNKLLRPVATFKGYNNFMIADDTPDSMRRRLPGRGR